MLFFIVCQAFSKQNKKLRSSLNKQQRLSKRSIVELIRENKISGAIGKQVIADMFNGDQRDAHDIVEAKGLILSDDTKLLEEICMQVSWVSFEQKSDFVALQSSCWLTSNKQTNKQCHTHNITGCTRQSWWCGQIPSRQKETQTVLCWRDHEANQRPCSP